VHWWFCINQVHGKHAICNWCIGYGDWFQ
jgi:hypothetical protein